MKPCVRRNGTRPPAGDISLARTVPSFAIQALMIGIFGGQRPFSQMPANPTRTLNDDMRLLHRSSRFYCTAWAARSLCVAQNSRALRLANRVKERRNVVLGPPGLHSLSGRLTEFTQKLR